MESVAVLPPASAGDSDLPLTYCDNGWSQLRQRSLRLALSVWQERHRLYMARAKSWVATALTPRIPATTRTLSRVPHIRKADRRCYEAGRPALPFH